MTDTGYALIVLKRDGAVVEVRNKGDGLAEVTVEIGDHKAARVIPSTVADNSDSAEFARVVRDLEEPFSVGVGATYGRIARVAGGHRALGFSCVPGRRRPHTKFARRVRGRLKRSAGSTKNHP